MRYLDAVALAKLKNIRLKLGRHVSEGHLTGRHRSARQGFAQEFAQHRSYVPGDELKRLDWKVYARKDRFFVKEFQEEKSLRTYLLLDASGSMAYRGSGPEPKWDAACRLAMSVAYLVLSQGDAAGLLTFGDSPREALPPRQAFSQLDRIDRLLAGTAPAGGTDLASVLKGRAGDIPRRSLVVLVSDLLGDQRRILEAVRAFHARKHRVMVLQVLDPSERDLEFEGPVLFESLEDGGTLRCEVGLVRESYREAFALQQRLYEASFRGTGVAFATFYTDVPWDLALGRFLTLHGAA